MCFSRGVLAASSLSLLACGPCRSEALDAEALPAWTAYFGGDSWESLTDVATDGAGNVYVGGTMNWAWRGAGTAYDMPGLTAQQLMEGRR